MTDYTSVFVEYTKTKAVSYRCHHPIQSGKNSISLSLHIYCEAMQQSGVASTSRHVKVCKAQVACKRHLSPPTLSFCWSGWHVGNNLIELSGQTKMNAFSYMKIKTWMLKPLGLVCCTSAVSLVLSTQSISHLLMSILTFPVARKRPSLGRKGTTQDERLEIKRKGRRGEISALGSRMLLTNSTLPRPVNAPVLCRPHGQSKEWTRCKNSNVVVLFIFHIQLTSNFHLPLCNKTWT